MIDLDRHYTKHCVRYYGWLPACKAHKRRTGTKPIKYFTLCAREALDVFMLESERILQRDSSGKLPNVVICEEDELAATEIFRLVRPPLKEAMIVGRLEDILTFEDTDETRGRDPDEEGVPDMRLRRLLHLKRQSLRLATHFPFDIVNFDPYGNLLSPDYGSNRLYKAFCRVFELQNGIETFLLLVTTPILESDPAVRARFRSDFESNLRSHPEIGEALVETLGTADYNAIDMNKRLAIDTAKSLISACARQCGWEHEHEGVFIYESPPRTMLSSVVRLWRSPEDSDEGQYLRDLLGVIRKMPEYYSWDAAEQDNTVREHLTRLITYRNRARDEFR